MGFMKIIKYLNNRSYKKLFFLIGVYFLLLVNFVSVQSQSHDFYPENVQLINPNTAEHLKKPDTKGYIIEFKKPPLIVEFHDEGEMIRTKERVVAQSPAIYRYTIGAIAVGYDKYKFGSNVKNYRNKLKNEHRELFQDSEEENTITGALAELVGFVAKSEDKSQVLGEFTYSFNGIFVANISKEDLEKIKRSDFVKNIYSNHKFDLLLTDSVPLINADEVWGLVDAHGNSLKGNGIRIGVIDTGIDYTHPDLGGCIGSDCKVKGGYDFVNNDNNPFDDVGHGTHVAGIIAANGALKGVAPNAELYAYKVCSQTGCWENDILAGIEHSIDPNQDENFGDHLNIISMSLGGQGDPDDILSTAIDNAADLGVVSVISAGNSGPNYNTIGSPGTARKAVTIAASSKNDIIAGFSSRGPTIIGTIKPDITAPGVAIQSTLPGNTYDAYSGTSMAAPHVSGVAALLLQKHPRLTPEQVKAVIVNNGIDLAYDSFTQGSGRVDALKAINTPLVITPSSFQFTINSNTNSFSNNFKIKLEEIIPQQNINLGIEAKVDGDNIVASVSPSSLTGLGESSSTISFSTKDGNNFREGIYSGHITFKDQNLNLKVIFSLIIDYTPTKILNPHVEQGLIGNSFGQNFVWYTDDLSKTTLFYRQIGTITFTQYSSNGKQHIFDLNNLAQAEYEYYITAANLVGLETVYDNNGNYFRLTVLPFAPLTSEGYIKVGDIAQASRIVAKDETDFDKDGKKEFITRRLTGTWTTTFDIYEHIGSNNFQVVSSINVPEPISSYYPSDVGDSDNDNLKELLVYGRTGNNFYVRQYESSTENTYPDHISWQFLDGFWAVGAKIANMDKDAKKEIVIGGQTFNYINRAAVYENKANDLFEKVYSFETNFHTSQSMEIAEDLDNDGKAEILYGGLIKNGAFIYMVENKGDDSYELIWERDVWTQDISINPQIIKYTGDLDNDNKKEFIAGGLEPALEPSADYWRIFYLFEHVSDNSFEPVWQIKILAGVSDVASLNIGDLDNDGKDEIIINVGSNTYIFENVGDNLFEPVWHSNQIKTESIGILDYDSDGYDEIIVNGAIYKRDVAVAENCEISGDEDNNGLADCVDVTPCPNSVYCNVEHTKICSNQACIKRVIEPQTGILSISSLQEGAAIYIDNDNKNYGYTNQNITLLVGNHFVILTKFGYIPSPVTNFMINAGEHTNLTITLQPEAQQTCSEIPDGACHSTCSAGSDADCCANIGKCWFSDYGCYTCGSILANCSVVSDNKCPSNCDIGSDIDCCKNTGNEWVKGKGCFDLVPGVTEEEKSATCSWIADNICPVGCASGSDADCCIQKGYFVLIAHLPPNEPVCQNTCYSNNYNAGTTPCLPCDDIKGYVSDGVCPNWCSAGNDIDCCKNAGKQWVDGKGCYDIPEKTSEEEKKAVCSVISDNICPVGCASGSDFDCCTNAGKCWYDKYGCSDCGLKLAECNDVPDGVCPANCAAGSDADCCKNAGKCWRQGQGCYSIC